MLNGETIATGAPGTCEDCWTVLELKPCRSAAGWYVGSECGCGPYSRESGYVGTREEAEALVAEATG